MKKLITGVATVACACMGAWGNLSVTLQGAGDSPLFGSVESGSVALTTDGLVFQLIVDTLNDTVISGSGGIVESGMLNLTGDAAFLGGIHSSADDDYMAGAFLWTYDSGIYYLDNGGVSSEYTFGGIPDANSSDHFYVRWFNSDSAASATEAGFIYSSDGTWLTPPSSDVTVNTREISYHTYGTSTRVAGNDGTMNGSLGWQTVAPVPEPTTLALLAIGMATLAVSRRRRT